MSQFGSLPLETVVDILARLSITSLGRCRCVCKSWHSLIADPFFINKQLCVNRHGRYIDGDRNHYFFLDSIFQRDCRNSSSRHEPYFYSRHSLHCFETFEESKRLQFPTDIGDFSIQISSCNGVLCLLRCHDRGYSYTIILWNPSINKFKILPKPGGQFETSSPVDVSVGIGFVPRTNDYKVVRLMDMTRNSDVFYRPQIEMYSLNTDSWTTWTGTYDVQWRLCRKTSDASVNGAVHWTARKTTWCDDDDNGSQLIVSFHLADEVLREICLPKCHCGLPNRNHGFISVIYEKLAFTIDCGDEDLFYQKVWEIWLLEDYNNDRESWTRFRTITMGPTCRNMVPVQFLNNGEFVVCSGMGRLIVFDPKTQQIVAKELRGSGFIVVNYTQSLVLVNEGTDAPSTEMSSLAKELKEFVMGKCVATLRKFSGRMHRYITQNLIEHGR
ncbi:putative F-box protein At3g16210 [Rhododendron vialii]|uniref:putative F-box protein At3g16210 n=1 Tax=Rhododendron vialii TaxID=182163 RepID=UPI00265F2C09|nr:putative F-box protein At3g16210 [Rhododendron vialii]